MMIRQVYFSNVASIDGRGIYFKFGTGNTAALGPQGGFYSSVVDTCAGRFEDAINAAGGYGTVDVTGSFENAGADMLFTFDFATDPGAFQFPDRYDVNFGVGGDFYLTQTAEGVDPDEYMEGGQAEAWSGYRTADFLGGVYTLGLYVGGAYYSVDDIPALLSYSEMNDLIAPVTFGNVGCSSGSGTIGDPYTFQWQGQNSNNQPACSFVNQTTVVSNVYEIFEGGGDDIGLMTSIAT